MQFLYPSFLWALLAIAIPIIIHLFFFRRFKKIQFTNVKYLKEVKEETASRNKLKNLLILLSRILAICSLVFAFAQPYIQTGEKVKQGSNAVSVFIDNSFSMQATQEDVPLIDIAKEKARQIINAYAEEDQFQILTHSFEGRHQRMVSKEDALSLIDEIDITPSVKQLSKVFNRQLQATANQSENSIFYIISDFQKSINDLNTVQDTSAELNLLPLQTIQEKNVSLDSVWLESPVPIINQPNSLLVKITNHSDEEAEGLRLSLIKNGQERPEGIFTIPARTTIIDTISVSLLSSGWHRAEVKITDYPVQFDDKYFITLNVPEQINVLSINNGSQNRYLNSLIKGLQQYEITNQDVNKVDYASFNEVDLIVLNDLTNLSSGLSSELISFVKNGGNLLVFPSNSADVNSYNNFFNELGANNLKQFIKEKKTTSSINKEEFIFNQVYEYVDRNIKLPTTEGSWDMTNFQNRAQEALIRYRDGSIFLAKYVKGEGHAYISSAPLNERYNDLSRNAEIFVPMVYKMAIASTKNQQISYTIGQDEIIEVPNVTSEGDLTYRIIGPNEFIPGQSNLGNKILLDVNDQVDKSGYYDITLGNEKIKDIAFNFNRRESNMMPSSLSDLEGLNNEKIKLLDGSLKSDFSTYINEKDRGIILWKWCLIFALIFLAIEVLLLRLWKKK